MDREEAVSLEIDSVIEDNGLSDYLIVYTDGLVQRGVKSGLGYTASFHNKAIKEVPGYVSLITTSM